MAVHQNVLALEQVVDLRSPGLRTAGVLVRLTCATRENLRGYSWVFPHGGTSKGMV